MDTQNIELKNTDEDVTGTNISTARDFLTRALDQNGPFIIWMRGMPYKCTAGVVIEYFRSGLHRCEVLEDDVLIVEKKNGERTGDAFVLFANEADAQVALNKHRQLIGSRYIELFLSTKEKLKQVLDRAAQASETPPLAPPLLPQYAITCGTQKNCIRLHGMPDFAQVENIFQFLGEHAKNISFHGVHMIYSSEGKPSGNAFIQMKSEKSAYDAARTCHRKAMTIENRLCYVDVFQCSGNDTQLTLMSRPLCSGVAPNPGFETPSDVQLIPPTFYSDAPTHSQATAQQAPVLEASNVHLETTSPKSQYTISSPGYGHCPPQLPLPPHQYLMQQAMFQPVSTLYLPQPIYPMGAICVNRPMEQTIHINLNGLITERQLPTMSGYGQTQGNAYKNPSTGFR